MGYDDPDSIIESTLGSLDATRAYAESFRCDVIEAFESGEISERQFRLMRDRVEKFLCKLSLYKSVFEKIKDAYAAVK